MAHISAEARHHLAESMHQACDEDDALRTMLRTFVERLASIEDDVQTVRTLIQHLAAQLNGHPEPLQHGGQPGPALLRTLVPDPSFRDTPEQPHLRIVCFGPFEVHCGEESILESGSSKAWAILKYLASMPRKTVHREVLLDVLWPQVEPLLANNRLKVALHHLRQSWRAYNGETGTTDCVIFRDGCYGFDPQLSIWTDVEAFQHAWEVGGQLERAGDLAQAIPFYRQAQELYRGDFLEDDRFEEWTLVRREALKDIYLTILDKLSRYWLQRGDLVDAISGWQAILDKDPWREDVYRHLMIACAAAGQRGVALHWYDRCVQILKDQLDLDPEPETTALYHQLRHDTASGV